VNKHFAFDKTFDSAAVAAAASLMETLFGCCCCRCRDGRCENFHFHWLFLCPFCCSPFAQSFSQWLLMMSRVESALLPSHFHPLADDEDAADE